MRKREGRWLSRRRAARRPVPFALARLFGPGADRGASAVELAILAPALIFLSMLIIQFALWLDATHAALAAAQEGDRAARAAEFNSPATYQQTAINVAMNYYRGLDTSVLGNVTVSRVVYNPGANTVTLTVSGQLNGIFPLTVTETVTGPVECFRTSASQGAKCG